MQPDTTPSSIEADALSREELITMAREADPFGDDGRLVLLAMLTPGTLERFAALVAAREREACAQVCRHAMQCAINKTDSQRILELTAQLAEAQRDARGIFDAGWKAAASFCERDDVLADGIVGEYGCPQFERACADAIGAAKEEKNGA